MNFKTLIYGKKSFNQLFCDYVIYQVIMLWIEKEGIMQAGNASILVKNLCESNQKLNEDNVPFIIYHNESLSRIL